MTAINSERQKWALEKGAAEEGLVVNQREAGRLSFGDWQSRLGTVSSHRVAKSDTRGRLETEPVKQNWIMKC